MGESLQDKVMNILAQQNPAKTPDELIFILNSMAMYDVLGLISQAMVQP